MKRQFALLEVLKGTVLVIVLSLCLASVQVAHAGTIILEGSDAIGFHSNDGGSADAYKNQVWSAIGGADPRPIAVIGADPLSAGVITSSTHAISRFQDTTAAGTLSDYVALYFLAGFGCCTEDDSLPAGHEADISAYLAAGGTVMIENYIGGAAWDFAVGTGGAGNAHVAGFGAVLPGPGCDDNETVTADGITNGFTQPTPLGCWTHQGYDTTFFGPLGFTHNFFDSGPAFASLNPGLGPFSSLLSSGKTVTGGGGGAGVPEPSTLILLGSGLAGLGLWRRFKARI